MVEQYIRPYIRNLIPYSTARDEYSGRGSVFLDANENPFETGVNRYPDPHQKELKEAISRLKGVSSDLIFLGNGSDEAIDLLVRITTADRVGVTIMPPTYGMYKVASLNNGLNLVEAPLRADFSLNYEAISQANKKGSELLFVCSPNNPTGNQYSLEEIERVLSVFAGVVVVDEAYVDFAKGRSATALLPLYDRLVVLQTFSKAWGMAGARVGVAFASRPIIGAMNKLKLPYNISSLSQSCVLERLQSADEAISQCEMLRAERSRFMGELQAVERVQRVYESEGNFLLVRIRDAHAAFLRLRESGVIVRDRSKELHCDDCLRITVGTRDENERVLNVLRGTI